MFQSLMANRRVLTVQGRRVIVAGSTAKAADMLDIPSAATLHYMLGLSGGRYRPCISNALNVFIDLADVIIVDEYSMAAAELLEAAHCRCVEAAQHGERQFSIFAGKKVILCGDPHQLPAVCRRCKGDDCPHQPYRWQHFAAFRSVPLVTNVRQAGDEEFAELLFRMRTSLPTAADLQVLAARVVRPPTAMPEEAIIVAGLNSEVRLYNRQQLQAHHPDGVTEVAAAHTFGSSTLTAAQQADVIASLEHRCTLPSHLNFAANSPAICIRNLRNTLYNGARLTVLQLAGDRLRVRLPSGAETTISRVNESQLFGHGMVTRSQFPVLCSYARTVHRVQGETFQVPVYIDPTSFQQPGQGYVALSRAKTLSKVFFVLAEDQQLEAAMFTPHVPQH